MSFKKAVRTKVKLKLSIAGPSGSGKTYSALRMAKGILNGTGKIALIDTENESASLYADLKEGPLAGLEFDVMNIYPPYTTEKYMNAWQEAVKAGYDVVITDSISHQWAGDGGILNRKEKMDVAGGNSFTNWGKMTPEQEKFKSAILHAPVHMIVTMRSKQDYVMSDNGKGKQAPQKVGLAPVQRDGMEYEFTTAFEVAMNHEAVTSKDRTGLFIDQFFQITEDTGQKLRAWLDTGATPEAKTIIPNTPNPKPGPQNNQSTGSHRPQPTPLQQYIMWSGSAGDFPLPVGPNKGQPIKTFGSDYNTRMSEWLRAEYASKKMSVPPHIMDYLFTVQKYVDQVNSPEPPAPIAEQELEMDVPDFGLNPNNKSVVESELKFP